MEESEAEGEQDENENSEAGEEGEEGEEEKDELDEEVEEGVVDDVDVEGLMEGLEEGDGDGDKGTKVAPPKKTNMDQAETLEMDYDSYWRIDPSFGNGVSPLSAKKEEEPTEPKNELEKPKQFKRSRKQVKGSEDQVKESEENSVPLVEDLCSDDEKHEEKGTFQADGGRLDLGLTSGTH